MYVTIHIYFAYKSGLSAVAVMQSDPLIPVAAGLFFRKLSCLTLKRFASAMLSALPKVIPEENFGFRFEGI